VALYTSGFVCQSVLQEKDANDLSPGVLSAIRILDRVVVNIPPPTQQGLAFVLPTAHCVALVIFKSDSPEEFDAILTVQDPSGQPKGNSLYRCKTGGGVLGHVLKIDVLLDSNLPGLWYIDVSVKDKRVLRIPVEVIHTATVQLPPPSQTQGKS